MLIAKSKVHINTKKNKDLVRPTDINLQVSNSSLFNRETGWKEKYNLNESINYLLDETRKILLWKKYKVLITGGAGYIGSMLSTKLIELGYIVTVIDTLTFFKKFIKNLFIYKNFKFFLEM